MGLIPKGTHRELGLYYSGVIFQHLPSPALWNLGFFGGAECRNCDTDLAHKINPKFSSSSELWGLQGRTTHFTLITLNHFKDFFFFNLRLCLLDIRWHITGWLNDWILSRKVPMLLRRDFNNFMWIPDFLGFPLLFFTPYIKICARFFSELNTLQMYKNKIWGPCI